MSCDYSALFFEPCWLTDYGRCLNPTQEKKLLTGPQTAAWWGRFVGRACKRRRRRGCMCAGRWRTPTQGPLAVKAWKTMWGGSRDRDQSPPPSCTTTTLPGVRVPSKKGCHPSGGGGRRTRTALPSPPTPSPPPHNKLQCIPGQLHRPEGQLIGRIVGSLLPSLCELRVQERQVGRPQGRGRERGGIDFE